MSSVFPENWSATSAESLSTLITKGSSPNWQGFKYQDSGALFVTSENVRDGYLDVSTPKFLPLAFSQKEKRSRLQYGDILINIVGASIGRSCKFNLNDVEANINQAVCVLRPKSPALGDYIFQYLQSPMAIRQLLGQQSDSARPNLSLEDIRNLVIPIPPEEERQHISELLSAWDRAIETVTESIANGETAKKGHMALLLSGKKRLPGFTGEWKRVRYSDVLKEIKRPVNWSDAQTYNLISVRRRSGGAFHRESLVGHEILTKNMSVAKAGDFVISKMQILHGASAVIPAALDGYHISGSYISLMPRDQSLDINFMGWISKTPRFYHQTYISSYGVHIEKMTFILEDFFDHDFLMPTSREEQLAIVGILDALETEVSKRKEQLQALRTEKAALMQQLLTGKRRVSTKKVAA
jgi:type I restriction enzyme S subunit